MSARDRILDTLEAILISEGERAATLDAVAARAEVSKGGLLYHFPNREALIGGLVERARNYAAAYRDELRSSPDGPTVAYIRTSAETNTAFDRTLIALGRLGGDQHPEAASALRAAQQDWVDLVREEIGDEATARAIVLMGDGLYYNAMFQDAPPRDVDGLLRIVEVLRASVSRG